MVRRVLILSLLVLMVALVGCSLTARGGAGVSTTSTTAAPTLGTTLPNTAPASASASDGTYSPPAVSPDQSGFQPTTTIFIGTTLPYDHQTRALPFVGRMTKQTFQRLRQLVISSNGDGEKVLESVSALAVAPSVQIPVSDLDAVGGVGFTAGASTSQPIAVAADEEGNEVMVFAYTVGGDPDAATVVGFDVATHAVRLVEGPLPITNATRNATTIPSATP